MAGCRHSNFSFRPGCLERRRGHSVENGGRKWRETFLCLHYFYQELQGTIVVSNQKLLQRSAMAIVQISNQIIHKRLLVG